MTTEATERRRCFRARIAATATLRPTPRGRVCVCAVDDLSLGGAHLAGRAPGAPGEVVATMIRLPGHRPFHVSAHLVRETPDGGFAIAFDHLSPRVEDAIHDLIVRALEGDDVRAVLVVDANPRTRATLARLLSRVGCRTFVARTPIEAIAELTRHEESIETVMVSADLTQTTGVELASFIKDAFPSIRRIMTTPQQRASVGKRALSQGLVDSTLVAPYRRRTLQRVLRAEAQ